MNFDPWRTWQKIRLAGVICVLLSAFILQNSRTTSSFSEISRPGFASGGGLDHGGSALAAQSGLFKGRKTQRTAWWLLGLGISLMIASYVLKKIAERTEKKILIESSGAIKVAPREPTAIVRSVDEEDESGKVR